MPLWLCQNCGGVLRRTRRTLFERLFFTEAYECRQCGKRTHTRSLSSIPTIRHAHYVKCPRCHSVDLSILRRRDGVDRMQPGLFNLLHRMGGGKLYHCWFCRLQFYDLRQQFNSKSEPKLASASKDPTESDTKLAS